MERYLRYLAEDLAGAGHGAPSLAGCEGGAADPPHVPGVRVVAVSREEPLYDDAGRRRIGEAVRYGAGVFAHLVRARRRYDVIHLVGFPYFSVLAARLALLGARRRIVVDWIEVWSRDYWREYLGAKGRVGHLVQRLCVRLTPEALVFSELHANRLSEEGLRGPVTRVPGPVGFDVPAQEAEAAEPPVVVFAGRMTPEKRAPVVPAAIAAARRSLPELR